MSARGEIISVVVLGYNCFAETTGRCLASIAEDPGFSSWDVVLVDNGSDATNRAAFAEAKRRIPALKLVRLDQNAGYPGGMNAGLRAAAGDPLILVTSDVLIPPGTVGRLASILRSNPRAGMVAPVSNAAGNEQQIFVQPGLPVAEILRQGREFAAAGDSGLLRAYRIDMYVVALARAVYDAIGGLDESYIPGYYDDFDYSLKASKAGFDLLVAETAFVYHEGGATFGRASKEKKALIARNKQRFLETHGSDTPLPHIRDCNLAMLRQYAEAAEAGAPPPPLRIANRLKLAELTMPRGLLKRWRYRTDLAAVSARLSRFANVQNAET